MMRMDDMIIISGMKTLQKHKINLMNSPKNCH